MELFDRVLGRSIAAAELPAFNGLADALGHLPLALSLAAEYLREGYTTTGFLDLFRAEEFCSRPLDPAHPAVLADQARAIVGRTFDLSLALLRHALSAKADRSIAGFFALGYAPPAGFGPSLGAAIAELDESDFLQLMVLARRHSLLDRLPGTRARWALHPLLAEMAREHAEHAAVRDRITTWFVDRLDSATDANGVIHGPRWSEVSSETAALTAWLDDLPQHELARVAVAGSEFSFRHGPFLEWQRFFERALPYIANFEAQAQTLFLLGYVAQMRGDTDTALSAAEQQASLSRSCNAPLWLARAKRRIAELRFSRGEPNIALSILRNEVLPMYEELNHTRERALTLGAIADCVAHLGDVDEALRIYYHEVLPVTELLGDARERMMSLAHIACLFSWQANFEEAVRILRHEVIPEAERLGYAVSVAQSRFLLAEVLLARKSAGDYREAGQLLRLALCAARRFHLSELADIEATMLKHGIGNDDASNDIDV